MKMTQKKKDLLYSILIVGGGLLFLILTWLIAYLCKLQSSSFFGSLFRYDAIYYDVIVKEGYIYPGNTNLFESLNGVYHKGSWNGISNYPFFALYPFMIKVIYLALGKTVSPNVIGCTFSVFCLIGFVYLLIQYLRKKNKKIHWPVIIILFVFNQAMIYFYSFYTESFFMLLAMLVIYFSDDEQFVLAGLCGAILTSTRINGLFFLLYLFVRIYQHNGKERKEAGLTVKWWEPILDIIKQPKQLFSLAIFPLGLAVFMLYLHFVVKLPVLAFRDIQVAFSREFSLISVRLVKTFSHGGMRVFQAIYTVLCYCFMVFLVWKKRYLAVTLTSLFSLITLFTSFASYDRYVIGMLLLSLEFYYLFLSIASIQQKKKRTLAYTLCIVVLVAIVAVNVLNISFTFFLPNKGSVVY